MIQLVLALTGLVVMAWPLAGAQEANAIVAQLIEAERLNEHGAQQYTYTEDTDRYIFDKAGRARKTGSETHEVIFVEGLKYNKLVARNGKPISGREKGRVEKDMRETAGERRRHERRLAPGGVVTLSGPFTHGSLDLGSLAELLSLFVNRLAGEEEIRGHHTWVIESVPRQEYTPGSEHERQVRAFRKKFWIDQADHVLVRAVYTVAVDDAFFSAGSSLTFESDKIDATTWELVALSLDFSRARGADFAPTARTLYHMSNFRKFDVQSTITIVQPEIQ